jgi:lipoprotein-anchoring transpeptidase ErfK/SrfK
MRQRLSTLVSSAAALLIALAVPASAAPPVTLVSADAEATAVAPPPPSAVMTAQIDISEQTMTVYVNQWLTYSFQVSTARRGYITPVGEYQALWLSPKHRSRKYDNAPMPWAVFFHGGYAVHGTTDIRHLGKPASHGCVRLHPTNARLFFSLVKVIGKENSHISVVD